MNNIYTSYYARVAKLPNVVPIRISRSEPSWFPKHCEVIEELYPSWDLIKGIKQRTITWEYYEKEYRSMLTKLSKEEILFRLEELAMKYNGLDLALVCYESPEKHCHRHIVSDWLNCGIEELII